MRKVLTALLLTILPVLAADMSTLEKYELKGGKTLSLIFDNRCQGPIVFENLDLPQGWTFISRKFPDLDHVNRMEKIEEGNGLISIKIPQQSILKKETRIFTWVTPHLNKIHGMVWFHEKSQQVSFNLQCEGAASYEGNFVYSMNMPCGSIMEE